MHIYTSIGQFLGVPALMLALLFFKWGFGELNKRNFNSHSAATNIGTGFLLLLFATFLFFDKVKLI